MAKPFAQAAGRAIRTAAGKTDSRNALIKAVRAAARRLKLEDDDRRAIQREVTGKVSLGEMNLAEIGKVLDRLNRDYKGPSGARSHLAKIKALWWSLYWLGAVDEPNETALAAFVHRQTGKQRLPFLGHQEAFKVIEALKSWAARSGVAWPGPERVAFATGRNPAISAADLDRYAVLDAIGWQLQRRNVIGDHDRYLQKALGLDPRPFFWTGRELDAGIKTLGKMLRRSIEKEREAG